jgi:lysophospholipase L1-like esterase
MIRHACLLFAVATLPLAAREAPALPAALSAYQLDPAPVTSTLLLKKGDRLAICGDSITEQKRYSVLIETYLTACLPELEITCRQYGWSGEQAGGFLKRMESDVLRFQPTLATTCYGMNDFRYVPYDEAIASEYRQNQTAIVRAFKQIGCRVIVGSSGIIDSVPKWVKSAKGTQQDLNLSLARFRNVAVGTAKSENVAFADVYQPMLLADHAAKQKYGPDFQVSGKDGVHPDWAGQVVMAYAFLKAMGIDGDLGTVTFDETTGKATAAGGHQILSAANGKIALRSHKLPFSPGPGPADKDSSVQAGLALVPFHDELNRLTLRIAAPQAAGYTVTWGETSKNFTGEQLVAGINLAKEFDANPLVAAFQKVQGAVTQKQTYETRQIKELAHGPEGAADPEATFALTEKARAPLAKAVQTSLQPVEHSLTITRAAPLQ